MLKPRIYLSLLSVGLLFSLTVAGQSPVIYAPEEEILFFTQKIDSLPYYIRKGWVRTYPVCQLKEHTRYGLKSRYETFSEKALHLPDSIRHFYVELYALMDIASQLYVKTNYDSAFLYWNKALDLAVKYHFEEEELHDLRVALNNNFFLMGNYTGAMRNSIEGLEKAEQIGDENRMAHFNNVIGYIYMKLGDFAKANNYFLTYLHQARNMKDSMEEAHALYNLGDLAIAEKLYDKALDIFEESLKTYNSIKSLSPGLHEERKAYLSNKFAECWKLKGNPDRAMRYISAPLAATNMTSSVNAYDKADYFINGGDIYNRLAKPDSAMILLKKGLDIAISIKHREFNRDALEQIAISFGQKKIYDSAFFYQTMFSRLRDTIVNEIGREEIYQQDNDLQMERQQQVQKTAMQRQRFWRNIIIAVAVFLLLIVVFFYNRYQLRQKNRYQKELNRQQNELFNAIAAAQDQERKRIAQDIHDSLGAILSAAKLRLSAMKDDHSYFTDEQKETYETSLQLLDEASSELRHISHNIMPASLSKLGLVAALKNLSNSISSHSGLQINFSTHDFAERVNEEIEMSLYRIVLELINNIVKHAVASAVTVQLIKYPDHINLSVEDNGQGFDYKAAILEKKGIGLGNILSRVDYLKGTINIDAVPGRGTIVIIDVPLQGTVA